jgi:putative Mg2+ transporter-C (MgtC) family protein
MLTPDEIIARLLLSTLLGGIIGFERQAHGRPAGFRTQLLVCVACTLLMVMSDHYYTQSSQEAGFIRFDPTRIAAGAMTGIGFLGAGVILKTTFTVHGLTTAACIWIVAAIGLAVGAGQYVAGISGFVITVMSLWVLRIFEGRIPRLVYKHVRLVSDDSGDEETVRSLFECRGCTIDRMNYDIDFIKKEKTFMFTLTTRDTTGIQGLISAVSELAFVKRFEIKS